MRRNNGEFARVTLIPAIGSYRASIEAVPMNGVGLEPMATAATANESSRPKRAGGERQVPGNPIRLWASYPRIYRFYVLA